MKIRILIFLLIVSTYCFGQGVPKYTTTHGGYNFNDRLAVGGTFHVPAGGTPALSSGGWVRAGALYVDTTGANIGLYYSVGGQFVRVIDTTQSRGRNGLTSVNGFTELYGTTTKDDTVAVGSGFKFVFRNDPAATFAGLTLDWANAGSGDNAVLLLDAQSLAGTGIGYKGKDPGLVRMQVTNTLTPTEAAAAGIAYLNAGAGFTGKLTNANIIYQMFVGAGSNAFADSSLLIRTTGAGIQYAVDNSGYHIFKGSASNLQVVYGGFRAGGHFIINASPLNAMPVDIGGKNLINYGKTYLADSSFLAGKNTFFSQLGSSSDSVYTKRSDGTLGTVAQFLNSGTYSPTATTVSNMDAVTISDAQYMRVGNVVTVSGRITADATAAGSASFRITLPIASNLTGVNQLGGTAYSTEVAAYGMGIQADATNDAALFKWIAVDLSSRELMFTFTYQIL